MERNTLNDLCVLCYDTNTSQLSHGYAYDLLRPKLRLSQRVFQLNTSVLKHCSFDSAKKTVSYNGILHRSTSRCRQYVFFGTDFTNVLKTVSYEFKVESSLPSFWVAVGAAQEDIVKVNDTKWFYEHHGSYIVTNGGWVGAYNQELNNTLRGFTFTQSDHIRITYNAHTKDLIFERNPDLPLLTERFTLFGRLLV